MNKNVSSRELNNLPPLVNGTLKEILQIRGKIKFQKDSFRILCKQRKFCIRFIWWGETEPVTTAIRDNCTFQLDYAVKTNRKLFEQYLKASEDYEIHLVANSSKVAATKVRTKDLKDLVEAPKFYVLADKSFNCVAKVKLDFEMLAVENYSQPITCPISSYEDLHVSLKYLVLTDSHDDKLPPLITTDFRIYLQNGDDVLEFISTGFTKNKIYFKEPPKQIKINPTSSIDIHIYWRHLGELQKYNLGSGLLNEHSKSGIQQIPISSGSKHVGDLFVVLGLGTAETNQFTCRSTDSTEESNNPNLNNVNGHETNGNDEELSVCPVGKDYALEDGAVLHGLFYIGRLDTSVNNSAYILNFKTFWSEEDISTRFPVDNNFNFIHDFTISTNPSVIEKLKNHNFIVNILDKTQTVFGTVSFSLQQYYIAFRDKIIINHLKKSKLPVVSSDGYVPIKSKSNESIGKIQAILAIGTKSQIEFLKSSKNLGRTADPLGTLLEKLKSQMQLKCPLADNLLPMPKYFQFSLEINSAFNLPKNPAWKKGLKKTSSNYKMRQSRYPPNEEPNAYVTFQAEEGYGNLVKSHEGMVYASAVANQSSNPVWNQRFLVVLSSDYLLVEQKRFIMKIWKKAITQENANNPQPCPMEDAIIGFSAIDLSGFKKNTSITEGVYNIVDFNGRINGQIKIIATGYKPFTHHQNSSTEVVCVEDASISRAMKRKFTELEEISQRLRARLFDVTGEAAPDVDLTEVDDEEVDEFERDLNTECGDDNLLQTGEGEYDWLARTPSDFNTGRRCPKEEKIRLISEFLKSNNGGGNDGTKEKE